MIFLLAWAAAQGDVPDVKLEVAFPKLKFDRVTSITHPPDGTNRIFVIEQHGVVRWFENKPDVAASQVALDLSDKVLRKGNEEGLLGIAFHPKFKSNGFVFLQYSFPKDNPKERRNILSRFTMNQVRTAIVRESEKLLLEVKQPFENHNGGNLQFGPDGYLYFGLGDGGAANDPLGSGQKLTTMLGKFHRIDVDKASPGKAYGIPPDNPFVGRPDALPEIWSYGWRNPWGFHFDRKTGELWSGDVGQDIWEEINIVKKGGNYGWNVREAMHKFRGDGPGPYEEPIVEHHHREAKSITGGCVYRGKARPDLDGVYFYADFVTGNVWGLRYDGKKLTGPRLITEFKMKQISAFGEDREGEVYFASFPPDGQLHTFR